MMKALANLSYKEASLCDRRINTDGRAYWFCYSDMSSFWEEEIRFEKYKVPETGRHWLFSEERLAFVYLSDYSN